jgi:hypothetical protein
MAHTQDSLQELLNSSPLAELHAVHAGEDGRSVELTVARDDTGKSGKLHRSIMVLLLMAAGHAIVEGQSEEGADFWIRVGFAKAPIGATVVATAMIDGESPNKRVFSIVAELRDKDTGRQLATAKYTRHLV